jgi:hypothetical protein
MRMGWKVVALAIPLFMVVACGQSEIDRDHMETKHTYSLCPKSEDARQRLHEQVKAFAGQQNAQIIDRSAGAQQELSNMASNVLDKTGGSSILLTVEKPDDFRISVTNLGLKEKIALTIRTWSASGEVGSVAGFMDDLGRYWTIRRVEGGVTDDPPC